ncbi:MAG: hypothetical protein GY832_39140 [Chloroflexi bacterium]|nr:hypothetical protein [Chloroflexota bacterium]
MSTESLHCPNCGAALRIENNANVVECTYCHSTVRIATDGSGESILTIDGSQEDSLPPEVVEKIEQLLREGQRIEAIKVYRQHTNIALKEAKDAVDALGERIGVTFDSSASGWSCRAMVLGFLLWMGLVGSVPILVGKGFQLAFGDSILPEWVEGIQAVSGLCAIWVSIVGFIVWANVSNGESKKSND